MPALPRQKTGVRPCGQYNLNVSAQCFVTRAFLKGSDTSGDRLVDRFYQLLLDAGYPSEGIEFLRRHRLATIIVMALAAWGVVIGLGWLVWLILT
jgi:hypothetical protein